MKNNFRIQFDKLWEPWEAYLRIKYPEGEMFQKIKKFWEDEQSKCEDIKISREDLKTLLHLRNVRAHRPSFLEIKPSAVQKLKEIVNAFCKKAIDIATPEKEIYTATLNSHVHEVVKKMEEKLYTHVPIIDEKEFFGAFSENTLLKLIAHDRYTPDIKMNDIKKFLKDRRGTDDYLFLTPDTEFYKIYNLFQDYIYIRQRLGVIFLTEDGKESSKIKGLITAWDLHKVIS